MDSYIHSVEYYLPENTVDNKVLSKEFPEWEADKILEKVGIRSRHIVAEKETALDLAYNASEKALKNFDRQLIDFVLLVPKALIIIYQQEPAFYRICLSFGKILVHLIIILVARDIYMDSLWQRV